VPTLPYFLTVSAATPRGRTIKKLYAGYRRSKAAGLGSGNTRPHGSCGRARRVTSCVRAALTSKRRQNVTASKKGGDL
jgi:hypothetical protein